MNGVPIRPPRLPAVAIVLMVSVAGAHVAQTQTASGPLFVDAAAAAGLLFNHINGATGQYYLAEEMGAGVALFDYDNDGDLDVFLVQGGALGPETRGGSAGSRLFRNDMTTGAGGRRPVKFTDVTDQSRIDLQAYGMGAAVGDYDDDGWLDLFVTSFGHNALYRNNRDGTFIDVTRQAGLGGAAEWGTSAAFFDYDRDGHLDLFVANYLDFTLAGNKVCYEPAGARDYCSPRVYRPVPDRLYHNDGNGQFTDVTEKAGIRKAFGAGLGVAIGDYNGDGWLDVYVANDGMPNQLWINRHDGTFDDRGLLSGSAVNAVGTPEASMGIASGDMDADGDEDLFVTNLVGETSVLYVNDGHGNFEDARVRWALASPTASFTGFGTGWLDYDHDGWLDLFVTNGGVNLIEAQRGQPRPFRMRNQLFHNTGAGRFEEIGTAAGAAFARLEVGRGAAFGDIDNDGDVDIVVTNNGGPAILLLNQNSGANHWLEVRLEQSSANRFAFGGRVGVERAGRPTLWRRVGTDGSYLSASDVRAYFGLGSAAIAAVVVQWPDGQTERWTGIARDRLVKLRRGGGAVGRR